MRQLVVFFGAIGDTILLAPTIKKLCEKGDVFVIGYPERMCLLENVGWVQKTYSPEEIDFSSFFNTPSEKLKCFLTSFDPIFFFLRDSETLINFTKEMGISNVFAFPGTPPENWDLHASDYYLNCLGFSSPKDFILPIKTMNRHEKIIIHPGSGSVKKNMPYDFFAELTDRLKNRGLPICWCLGPAEEGVKVPHSIPTIQEANLIRLSEYIAGAKIFVGNDSGISHIAGAIGVNTITIFRTTNPVIWKPLGPKVYVFQDEPNVLHKVMHTLLKFFRLRGL